jgi:RecA-family ATPase
MENTEVCDTLITFTCTVCGNDDQRAECDNSLGGLCIPCYRERIVQRNEEELAEASTIPPPQAPAQLQDIFVATNRDGDIFTLHAYAASDITPRAIEWIWPDRIPAGKITLYTGKPDCGKTLALCDLIARVSTGNDWPDGSKNTNGPKYVLMASSEDDPVDTLIPRLLAAGADVNRVRILDSVTMQEAMKNQGGAIMSMRKGERRTLMLKAHVKIIKGMLKKHPDTTLVALDPLTAYLGADANKDTDIRPVMEGMADAVRGTRASIVGLIHHNKRSDVDALQKILGASSVAGVARAAWGFGRDPDDRTLFYMALVKGNLAKKRTGMKYRIEEVHVDSPDGPLGVPRIQWDGQMDEDANDMLAAERDKGEKRDRKLDLATALIKLELERGPRQSREVYAKGESEGIGERTMKTAARQLGIVHEKRQNGWFMSMPVADSKMADPEVM